MTALVFIPGWVEIGNRIVMHAAGAPTLRSLATGRQSGNPSGHSGAYGRATNLARAGAGRVFRGPADVIDAWETAWNRFSVDHALIRSFGAVGGAPASPAH